MDIDNIPLGVDFDAVIDRAVGKCDILIAVIGERWLHLTDNNRIKLIDKVQDFVRVEIAAALKRNIVVIPVLLDNVTMPRADELPDDLRPLARKNAIEISHTRFNVDVDRLIKAIDQILNEVAESKRVEVEKRKKMAKVDGSAEALSELRRRPVKNSVYRYVVLNFVLTQAACSIYHFFYDYSWFFPYYVGLLLISSIIPYAIFLFLITSNQAKTLPGLKLISSIPFILIPLTEVTLNVLAFYNNRFGLLTAWKVHGPQNFGDYISYILPFASAVFFAFTLKIRSSEIAHSSFKKIVLPFLLSLVVCFFCYSETFINTPLQQIANQPKISFFGMSIELLLIQFLGYVLFVEFLAKRYNNGKYIGLSIFLINILVIYFQNVGLSILLKTLLLLTPAVTILFFDMVIKLHRVVKYTKQ